jgi:hypothetical protein
MDHRIEFCERAIAAFFRSTDWQVRRLFVTVTAAMVVPNQAINVIAHMLPPMYSLAEDPVAAVRVAVLRAATRLRTFFQVVGDDQRNQELLNMFAAMDHTTDQFVDEIWKECYDKMEAKTGMSSLPKLPYCGSSSGARLLPDPQRRHSLASFTSGRGPDRPVSSVENQRPKLVVARRVKAHAGRATPTKPKMRVFALSDFKPSLGGSGDD